jgi:hypothetical protein
MNYIIRPNSHWRGKPQRKLNMSKDDENQYRRDVSDFLDLAAWHGFHSGDNLDWRIMLTDLDNRGVGQERHIDEMQRHWITNSWRDAAPERLLQSGALLSVTPVLRFGDWYVHGYQKYYAHRWCYISWQIETM